MNNQKYQHAKIYKIHTLQADSLIYIGGTTLKYLSCRFAVHKKQYESFNNNQFHYISAYKLFDLYGVNNCVITLIENVKCDNIDELRSRERFHILNTPNCINKNIPNRTSNDYYHDNYDKYKKYRIDNKEKIKLNSKNFNLNNPNYYKDYYNKNKKKLTEKKNCECGGVYTITGKSMHNKSKRHQQFLNKDKDNNNIVIDLNDNIINMSLDNYFEEEINKAN